ncbi:hypothetical protein DLAC_01673 [Tieghemostelium lacteum]|uniref:Transmembrane protein n=1 Tax=Tieghemostelium lacteum TaxID=361077 RepID=A0A152A604_TIELA|nr:hypothetical protein DLAC_01673 [Tieghemostelium lacteum]|eukprot:KYR01669.1 hypothetical protein DLAC_01673 [Tieghemostelium lacteum]
MKIIVLLLLTLFLNFQKVSSKIWTPVGVGTDFDSGVNWLPNGIPIATDDIIINGTDCIALDSYIVKSLTLESKLILHNSLESTGDIILGHDSIVILNYTDTGKTLKSGNFEVEGRVSMYRGHLDSLVPIVFGNSSQFYCEKGQCFIDKNFKTLGTISVLYGSTLNFNNQLESYQFMESDHGTVIIKGTDETVSKLQGQAVMSTSKLMTYTITLDMLDRHYYQSLNSSLVLNNSTLQFLGNSSIDLLDQSVFSTMAGSSVVMEDESLISSFQSKFTMNDNQLFKMTNSSSILFDTSTISIESNQVILLDKSILQLTASNMTVTGDIKLFNASVIYLEYSDFDINGQLTLNDKSYISLNNGSNLLVNGHLKLYNLTYVQSENSRLEINQSVLLSDQSYFLLERESNMIIKSNLSLQGTSRLSMINSNLTLLKGGELLLNSSMDCTNSSVVINGDFYSLSGPSKFKDTSIYVTGNTYLNGNIQFNQSSIVALSDFKMDGNILGNDLQVFTRQGNFKIGNEASFLCSNCDLINANGVLEYGVSSLIKLRNSTIQNLAGLIQTRYNNFEFAYGSNLVNNATIEFSANITHLDNSSQTVTNQGLWKFLDGNTVITIPFANQGDIIIDQNEITFHKFTHSSGSIELRHSTMSSPNDIHIQSGSLNGNGDIKTNIINDGELGHKFQKNQLNIYGRYKQGPESRMNIHLGSDDNQSVIRISNLADLNGYLHVNVSGKFASEEKQFKFLFFNDSVGDFKITTIEIYEKATVNDPFSNCDYKLEKGQGFYSLVVHSCELFTNEWLFYTYIGVVVGAVSLAVLVAILLIFKGKIKTKILLMREQSKFNKYSSNRDLSQL